MKDHLENIVKKYNIKVEDETQMSNNKRHCVKALQDIYVFQSYKDGTFFEIEKYEQRKNKEQKKLLLKLIENVTLQ